MGKAAQVVSEPASTRAPAPRLLRELLRDVSRSFYLTLRILPKPVRDQIGLAYLLARATDTIADTGAVPVEKRISALGDLRRRILAPAMEPIELPQLQTQQTSPAERTLLERINEALTLLFQFAPPDRELIQRVLSVISEGQELDLLRFGNASKEHIVALNSDAELHDYTFRVAGCVGEFWTRICVAHLAPKPRVSTEVLVERGIRFGKGLQLVNILRDIPADLANGRCYLPQPALQIVRLLPQDLLNPANEPKLRPVYGEWINTAEAHLQVAWQYVLDLPRSWWRVRLACAWPVLIGLRTLHLLKMGNVLNPDTRIKVSRSEIKRIVLRSVMAYPLAARWERLPASLRV
jgi:farnesyl-diphosphate farnesyltransferase